MEKSASQVSGFNADNGSSSSSAYPAPPPPYTPSLLIPLWAAKSQSRRYYFVPPSVVSAVIAVDRSVVMAQQTHKKMLALYLPEGYDFQSFLDEYLPTFVTLGPLAKVRWVDASPEAWGDGIVDSGISGRAHTSTGRSPKARTLPSIRIGSSKSTRTARLRWRRHKWTSSMTWRDVATTRRARPSTNSPSRCRSGRFWRGSTPSATRGCFVRWRTSTSALGSGSGPTRGWTIPA
ncbi:hypothetical protein DFJ74DRAFT_652311 [Hyaloraphidium curvatum]|nr:hypothetical protein DFJ74DRAFT_652311 [Hyaloraphidium curvatum]